MTSVLQLLAINAPSPFVRIHLRDNNNASLLCTVSLDLCNGEPIEFELIVAKTLRGVAVSEVPDRRKLPSACPERHINDDGSFCISWKPEGTTPLGDGSAAQVWWKELIGYLEMQVFATEFRRWPPSKSWAHGDGAQWQLEFERLAVGQPLAIVEAAKSGYWTPSRMWLNQVELRRRCCPCGSERRVKNCKHEAILAQLAVALLNMHVAERSYWEARRHQPCCGTMKDCPLAKQP